MKNLIILLTAIFSLSLNFSCTTLGSGHKGEHPTPEIRHYPTAAIQKFNIAEMYRLSGDYARAILEYQDAANLDTASVTIYTRLAEAYLNIHKYKDALDSYSKALDLEPGNSELRNIRAQISLLVGDVSGAEKDWQAIRRNDPDFLDAFFHLHELYVQGKDYDKAEENLRLLLKSAPDNEDALTYMTDVLKKENKLDEAIPYARKLIRLYPQKGPYYYSLIQIYLMRDKEDKALAVIRDWVEASDDKLESQLFLTNFYISRDEYDEAFRALQPLRSRWQENWWISHLAALIYESKNEPDSVLFYYNRAISFKNSGTLPFQGYAYWAYDHKMYDLALQVTGEGLKRDSLNVQLHLLRGNTYSEMGLLAQAVDEFETVMSLRPEDTTLAHQLALLYDRLGNYSKSDMYYQDLIAMDAKDDLALNNYSFSLAERGENLDDALDMVNRAIEVNPDNSSYYDTKAWILYKIGEVSQAYDIMQKVLQMGDANAEIYFHQAEILFSLNRKADGLAVLKKALELDPDYKAAQIRLQEVEQ